MTHHGDPAVEPCPRCTEPRFRHIGATDGSGAVFCGDRGRSPLPDFEDLRKRKEPSR